MKFEHQNLIGLLQEMPLLEWKWEHITMDFVVRLPSTQRGYDFIWVVVDRLTKSTHFILVKATYTVPPVCPVVYRSCCVTAWGASIDYFR